MAAYTVNTAKHATLVGSTEDTVTLDASGSVLVVRNRDAAGGDSLYFRYDGTAAVVGADNTYFVGPGTAVIIEGNGGFVTAVSLIATGTPDYSVELH